MFPLNQAYFPVTDPRRWGGGRDHGPDQMPVLHWLPGSSEPNRIQFLFYLFLTICYVPVLVFLSSFNSFQNECSINKQTSHNTNNSHQTRALLCTKPLAGCT